jgi:hypothetical protein
VDAPRDGLELLQVAYAAGDDGLEAVQGEGLGSGGTDTDTDTDTDDEAAFLSCFVNMLSPLGWNRVGG